jgi:hypothetical protein
MEFIKNIAKIKLPTSIPIGTSRDFLNSNTIISKFVFVFLTLILFMILANLGIILINYLSQPLINPFIVKGELDGKSRTIILQNPNKKENPVILRTKYGNKFTWSVWIFIDEPSDTIQNIFNKGNGNIIEYKNKKILSGENNGPGVYIKKSDTDNSSAKLYVLMDTESNPSSGDVNNNIKDPYTNSNENNNYYIVNSVIPIKKWFHMAIRLNDNYMDTYINGIQTNRKIFSNNIKQNYNDVNIGVFNGRISNLQYFTKGLKSIEINNIVKKGPTTKVSAVEMSEIGTIYPYHLTKPWFYF